MTGKKIRMLLLAWVALGLMAYPAVAGAKTTLTMAAMGKTSDTYMVAMGWSNVLNKIKSNIAITPLEGGGVVMLARGMAQGKWDIRTG